MAVSLSSSYLLVNVPAPPDPNQTLADIRADYLPEVLLFFSSCAGLVVVFWIVRTLSRAA